MDTKNNIENVLDKDASLAERVCTSDNINTYCFFYDPSTIVLTITDVSGCLLPLGYLN